MGDLIPAVVAIVGLAAYVWATHPKVAEVGRIMFAVGLLVVLAQGPAGRIALHLTR